MAGPKLHGLHSHEWHAFGNAHLPSSQLAPSRAALALALPSAPQLAATATTAQRREAAAAQLKSSRLYPKAFALQHHFLCAFAGA